MIRKIFLVAILLFTTLTHVAAETPNDVGKFTGLPLPRFVSLKSNKVNARRGPSKSYRIDWVYTRRNTPVQIIAEHEHWRRIVDIEGMGGWVHYILLSGKRTVLVMDERLNAYQYRDTKSDIRAIFEKGSLAMLDECDPVWCWIVSEDGHKGWVNKRGLWGVTPDEILE